MTPYFGRGLVCKSKIHVLNMNTELNMQITENSGFPKNRRQLLLQTRLKTITFNILPNYGTIYFINYCIVLIIGLVALHFASFHCSLSQSTLGDRTFPAAAARAWNSLPCHVRDIPSLLAFRRELKTVLFRLSYPVD